MLKKILNKNFRTLTLSPQAFFAELREWFFMIDNKVNSNFLNIRLGIALYGRN